MFWIAFGIAGFFVLAVIGGHVDPVGWGYLLSTRVEDVAEARLAEPLLAMPSLYFLASFVAAAGIAAASSYGLWATLALGTGIATFLLGTLWDMRRRRGSLAVYILLRREEIGFHPKGDVIEVPKLMFGVMNEPSPLVWLMLAGVAVVVALDLLPLGVYAATIPLLVFAVLAVLVWRIQIKGPWEPLARRLRRASWVRGERLVEFLEFALDLDPEVVLLRQAADAVAARMFASSSDER